MCATLNHCHRRRQETSVHAIDVGKRGRGGGRLLGRRRNYTYLLRWGVVGVWCGGDVKANLFIVMYFKLRVGKYAAVYVC